MKTFSDAQDPQISLSCPADKEAGDERVCGREAKSVLKKLAVRMFTG